MKLISQIPSIPAVRKLAEPSFLNALLDLHTASKHAEPSFLNAPLDLPSASKHPEPSFLNALLDLPSASKHAESSLQCARVLPTPSAICDYLKANARQSMPAKFTHSQNAIASQVERVGCIPAALLRKFRKFAIRKQLWQYRADFSRTSPAGAANWDAVACKCNAGYYRVASNLRYVINSRNSRSRLSTAVA